MSFSLNGNWTDADVAALLASVQDDRNWRIEVTKGGVVSLKDVSNQPASSNGLHCYFEAYLKGNGYVGPAAAQDQNHVSRTANALRRNWPNLEHDEFIDNY